MKTNFNVLEYFKGTNYDPEYYCGVYCVSYTYRRGHIEMDESTSRLVCWVPRFIYETFQRNEKLRTLLWLERIKPCSKYINKVEWLL